MLRFSVGHKKGVRYGRVMSHIFGRFCGSVLSVSPSSGFLIVMRGGFFVIGTNWHRSLVVAFSHFFVVVVSKNGCVG